MLLAQRELGLGLGLGLGERPEVGLGAHHVHVSAGGLTPRLRSLRRYIAGNQPRSVNRDYKRDDAQISELGQISPGSYQLILIILHQL